MQVRCKEGSYAYGLDLMTILDHADRCFYDNDSPLRPGPDLSNTLFDQWTFDREEVLEIVRRARQRMDPPRYGHYQILKGVTNF